MICLAISPAIDVTYRLDGWTRGDVNRVRSVRVRAGGKAINVARVARSLGAEVTVVMPVGGAEGQRIVTELSAEAIRVEPVAVRADTRRTVTILSGAEHPTGLYEPASAVDAEEWRSLEVRVLEHAGSDGPLVISGSLPASVEARALELLVSRCRARGASVIVDVSGPAMLAAASGGAAALKPNLDELAQATGEADWRAGAAQLLDRGAGAVLVSLGSDGLAHCSREGVVRTVSIPSMRGNPTGAGDAVVAGLASAIDTRLNVAETVRRCAAIGAAAVAQPLAGMVDVHEVEELISQVVVEEETWRSSI